MKADLEFLVQAEHVRVEAVAQEVVNRIIQSNKDIQNPYIQQFLNWFIVERGRSKRSAYAYRRELERFFSHLKSNNGKIAIEKITKVHIRSYLSSLGDVEPSTRERTVSCLKSFFRFLTVEGYISFNPAESIFSPVIRKKVPNFFTRTQYKKLLYNLVTRISDLQECRKTIINRLHYHKKHGLTNSDDIILILMMCGLNKKDIIDLKKENFSPQNGRVVSPDGNVFMLVGKQRSIVNYYINKVNTVGDTLITNNQKKRYKYTSAIPSKKDLLRMLGFSSDISQWKTLLDSIDTGKIELAYRNLAIITLLLTTGIRRLELVQLTKRDFSVSKSTIKVTRKGGNQQIIELNKDAVKVIKEYLHKRKDNDKSLFITRTGKGMTSENLHYIVKNILKDSNLKGSAHTLRHTFVTELVRIGVPLPVIQSLVGHRNADTTIRYTHIVSKDRRSAVSKISLGLS